MREDCQHNYNQSHTIAVFFNPRDAKAFCSWWVFQRQRGTILTSEAARCILPHVVSLTLHEVRWHEIGDEVCERVLGPTSLLFGSNSCECSCGIFTVNKNPSLIKNSRNQLWDAFMCCRLSGPQWANSNKCNLHLFQIYDTCGLLEGIILTYHCENYIKWLKLLLIDLGLVV